jgi:FixJ family two-component response regulator
MRVQVDLPDPIGWQLANLAEARDMRISDYLADLGAAAIARPKSVEFDPIIARVRSGLTDKQIAAELNLTNRVVADRRRHHGYPANKNTNPKEHA